MLKLFKKDKMDLLWIIEHFNPLLEMQLRSTLKEKRSDYNIFTTARIEFTGTSPKGKPLFSYVDMGESDFELLRVLLECNNQQVFDIIVDTVPIHNANSLLRIFMGFQKEVPFSMLLNALRSTNQYRINYDALARDAVTQISNLRMVAIIDSAFVYDVL